MQRLPVELLESSERSYVQGLRRHDEPISARRGYVLLLGALRRGLEALRQEALGRDLPGGKEQEASATLFGSSVLGLNRMEQ